MIAPIAHIPISRVAYINILERAQQGTLPDKVLTMARAVEMSASGEHNVQFRWKIINGKMVNLWSAKRHPRKQLCMWCRREFDWRSIGIPVEISESTVPRILDLPDTATRKNLRSIYDHRTIDARICGVYCSYSCCLSGVQWQFRQISTNANREKSLALLRQIHAHDYPEEELLPTPSPLLLESYGGFIHESEYDALRNSKPKYKPSNDFTLVQVAKNWIES